MQNEFMIFLSGITAGISCFLICKILSREYKAYRFRKNAFPHPVVEKRLCKGPHGWTSTDMFNKSGVYSVKVCKICGYLPESNEMVTSLSVEKIEEYNKQKQIKEILYKDFINQENKDIRAFFEQELKNGLDFEKLVRLHIAGTDFHDRFKIFFAANHGQVEKDREKGNA